MIIYKYQYEKECALKKMHCYWCLNNCTVREAWREAKECESYFLTVPCKVWVEDGGGSAFNRMHPTRCKQWKAKGKTKTPPHCRYAVSLPGGRTYKQIICRCAVFTSSCIICCAASLEERQRPECLQTPMIKTSKKFVSSKMFFFFFPLLLCVCLLICACKHSCICISNTHIWSGGFKCQDANWWQSPRLKSISEALSLCCWH